MSFKFIPNFLSILRIVLSLVFIFLMLIDTYFFRVISFIIFFICSLSDFLDGYIARKYKFQTNFGRYLDPIADKILILSGFITLNIFYGDYVETWMILLIFLRDFIITGLRMIVLKNGQVMLTSNFSKVKTLFQIIVIHIILFIHCTDPVLISTLDVFSMNFIFSLMIICVIYTILSGIHYIIINLKYIIND